MNKNLPPKRFFDFWLTVDDVSGHGSEYAILSLRGSTPRGRPGKRLAMKGMTRGEVVEIAFQLLDLADQMQPKTTYATSESVSTEQEPLPHSDAFFSALDATTEMARRRDVAERYRRLKSRMPLLQLAQRVLERCDDEIADTLHATLLGVAQTGTLPFSAFIEFREAPDPTSLSNDAKN